MTTAHKQRWFRFSLRTLFVVMTLAAAPMIWLSVQIHTVRTRQNFPNDEDFGTVRKWGGGRWKQLPWIWRQLDAYPQGRIQLLDSHWDEKGRARVQSLFPEADVRLVQQLGE